MVRDPAWVEALHLHCPWLPWGHLLPGVQADVAARFKLFKSIIKFRQADNMPPLKAARHALECEASLRILLAIKRFYEAPPPESQAVAGRFMITGGANGKHVDAATMDGLIAAASAAMARATAPGAAPASALAMSGASLSLRERWL